MDTKAQATYKIGQAAGLVGVKPYVLRFWETEFPQLAPARTETGQRAYAEADVALAMRIKRLLHDEGLTIDGARRRLEERRREVVLSEVRDELLVMRRLLADKP